MQLDDEGLCTAGPQGLDAYSTRHLHFHNGTSYHSAASSSQSSQPTRSPGNTNIHSIYEPSELGREYMQSLNMQNDLQVPAEARVTKAYKDNAEYGLFTLFFTAEFRRRLQTWTSNVLATRGQPKLTDSEFNAYLGLEMAMSICPLSDISEYWSESRFLGQAALWRQWQG
ncbi:hypothetical protein DVH05_019680 [Phytophthora capsici]|nr:hypothetical protein DVH05_019680 [Phytophthora capsici]